MNSALSSTILMVTHDAFSASYASRVIFIKDGSVFHEIFRGDDVRRAFFSRIIDVVTLLGGDVSDVEFKLSLRNLSHSIRDYAVYFINVLILGVMVFYLFNALDSQSVLAMVGSSSYEIIHQMMAFLYLMSFFVAFIMGFLVIYASRFLIRRRKREFSIYLLLGMSKKKISRMLLCETLLIGLLSLVIGLLLGIAMSQLMSIIVARMFEADMSAYVFKCLSVCAAADDLLLRLHVFHGDLVSHVHDPQLLAQRDASLTGQERDDPAKAFVAVPDRLSHRRGHARLCIL